MVVKASNCGGRSHSGSNISPLLHTVSGKDCPFTHLHTHISLSNGFEMQLEHTQVLLWCGQMPYRWFVFKLFPTHLITRVSPHTLGVYSWSLCRFSLFSSYSVELFFSGLSLGNTEFQLLFKAFLLGSGLETGWGHSRTLNCFLRSHSLGALAVCFGSFVMQTLEVYEIVIFPIVNQLKSKDINISGAAVPACSAVHT